MIKPAEQTGKDAQTGSAGAAPVSDAGVNDPFGMAQWMPGAALHPLMVHPTAAVAAATAIGFGMTGHFAGFMLGAMQGLALSTQKAAADAAVAVTPSQPVRSTQPVRQAPAVTVVEPTARTKEQRRPRAARIVETETDDLKRISGIGPKLEQVLNGMGIRRLADIARWSEKDMQRIDDQLGFAGRIGRDGWVTQAKALTNA